MDELGQVVVGFVRGLWHARLVARSWLSKSFWVILVDYEIVSSWLIFRRDLLRSLRSFNLLPSSTFNGSQELWFVRLSHATIKISEVNVSLALVINNSNFRLWVLFENSLLLSLDFLLFEVSIQVLVKLTCFKFCLGRWNFNNISIKTSSIEISKTWSDLVLLINITSVTIWNHSILRNGCLIILTKSRLLRLVQMQITLLPLMIWLFTFNSF